MMDYNGYLVHGLKFCCESEAILTMPLNVVDNHIKQKLKRARKKQQQFSKLSTKQNIQYFFLSMSYQSFNFCSIHAHLSLGLRELAPLSEKETPNQTLWAQNLLKETSRCEPKERTCL